jgi:hypothetical protein
MLLFRLPTWGKLLALILVGLPIVLLGSWLLMGVTDMAWGEAAQLAFYVLQNVPGRRGISGLHGGVARRLDEVAELGWEVPLLPLVPVTGSSGSSGISQPNRPTARAGKCQLGTMRQGRN